MARNVRTKEGIPPETTGSRGVPISRAQAKALRATADGFAMRVEGEDLIGGFPGKTTHAYVVIGTPTVIIHAWTGDALIEKGLWERCGPEEPIFQQAYFVITDAGRKALESGNIKGKKGAG